MNRRSTGTAAIRMPNPMAAIVWLALLAPARLGANAMEGLFPACVFLLGGVILRVMPSPWEAREPSRAAAIVFLLLESLYIVSTAYSCAFNGVTLRSADYFELARYLMLGGFAVYLIRHFDEGIRESVGLAFACFPYVVLLLLAGSWFRTGARPASFAAPFGNPDALGYAAVLALCHQVFFAGSRRRPPHWAAAACVVLLSGSRPAWAGALLIGAAALAARAYLGPARRRDGRALLLSLALFAALFAAGLSAPMLFGSPRIHAGRPPQAEAMRMIRRSPVLGWGPSGAEPASAAGSQYALWLLQSGALGLSVILAGAGIAGARLWLSLGDDPWRRAGAAASLAAVALMLSGGAPLGSYRLCFLTAFFLAAAPQPVRT
ncbi:MAG: hypothetical protein HY077_18475 [Elusimicrobia bacterium]|nr:hypothetical protein [Elusimicrobiota bacterium]